MRTYTARNRGTLIEQRNRNSLTHLIKNKDLTLDEKRALVAERNPFIYIFGTKLGGKS
jgi:hypothetical protein